MLSRGHTLFSRVDLTSVPAKQRAGALKLELEQNAPFEGVQGWVHWYKNTALVWYWPTALELKATEGPTSKPDVIPESALWPELVPGSFRWVQDQGNHLYVVQYQHPEKGLYEKRYAHPVTEHDIRAWLQRHAAKIDANTSVTSEPRPPLRKPRGESLSPSESSLETRVLPAMALLLVFFVVAYGAGVLRAVAETAEATDRAAQLEQEVAEVIEMRRAAGELRAESDSIRAVNQIHQVEVAASLAELLDINGGRLVRWSYRDGRLDLSWEPEGSLPDATDVISRLEESGRFTDVQAQNRGDTLVELSATVIPGGPDLD